MKVHIIYNPYKTDTKILINNRPIAKHSKLTKYSNVSFYAWCLQILNDIFEETNEEFDLTITSTAYFANLLKEISEHFDFCKQTTIQTPIINTTLQDRLTTIVEYLGIQEFYQLFDKIHIKYFSNDGLITDDLFKLLKNEINFKLRFMLSNSEYQVYSALRLSDFNHVNQHDLDDSIYIFDINTTEDLMSILKGFHHISKEYNHQIFLYPENLDVKELEVISLRNFGRFGIEFINNKEDIQNKISKIWTVLQYSVLTKKFKKLITSKNIHYSNTLNIKLLNRIDPILSTQKHITLNVGESYSIEPSVYPNNSNIEIDYMIDNANIKINSNIVTAYEKGITHVTVCLKNNPYVFEVVEIEVNEQISIEKMEFIEHQNILGVNDKLKLDINYFPTNAQNIHQIKYVSQNPEIAYFDDFDYLVANKPGKCSINAVVDNVVCSCLVEVKNKVTNINLSDTNLNLKMGQTHELEIEVYPKDAINSELEILCSNNVVKVFENKIKANEIGECQLIVKTLDNTISTTCKIIVESTLTKKETHYLTVSAILVTIGNLFVQNIFLSIIAIVLCFLCAKKKSSDIGLAIIFSIINIVLMFI